MTRADTYGSQGQPGKRIESGKVLTSRLGSRFLTVHETLSFSRPVFTQEEGHNILGKLQDAPVIDGSGEECPVSERRLSKRNLGSSLIRESLGPCMRSGTLWLFTNMFVPVAPQNNSSENISAFVQQHVTCSGGMWPACHLEHHRNQPRQVLPYQVSRLPYPGGQS